MKNCWLDVECCLLGASSTPSYTIRRPPYPTSSRCLPTGEPREHAPCKSGEIANRVNPHGPIQPRGCMKLWFATKMGKTRVDPHAVGHFLVLVLAIMLICSKHDMHAGMVLGFANRDPRDFYLFRLHAKRDAFQKIPPIATAPEQHRLVQHRELCVS